MPAHPVLLSEIRQAPFPWRFLLGAYAFSWTLWGVAAFVPPSPLYNALWLVGALGPALSGVANLYAEHGGAKRRAMRSAFWRRVIDPRYGGWRTLLPAVLIPLALVAVSVFFEGRTTPVPFACLSFGLRSAASVATLLAVLAATSQEIGWRGYALDELQTRWSPLVSALVIGLMTWLWLLPMAALLPAAPNQFLHAGPRTLPVALVTDLCISVLLTWLYDRGRRSVLAALIGRFVLTLGALAICPFSERLEQTHVALLLGVALAIGLVVPNFDKRHTTLLRVRPSLQGPPLPRRRRRL
jgi:membrane protease YdiL (CAAX protease family)